MVWKVLGSENDGLDLGNLAYGDPELVKGVEVENDSQRTLTVRVTVDEDLQNLAEKVVLKRVKDCWDWVEENEEGGGGVGTSMTGGVGQGPVGYRKTEDDNLMFSECELEDTFDVEPASTLKLFLFFRPLAVAGTDDKLELNKFTGSIIFEDISPEPDPDEDPTLFMKLLVVTGRISTSLISSEVTELSFNSCIPFKKYIKDFTVWNCSDLPTVFRLRSTSMTGDNGQRSQPLLEFTDYETGETLSTTGGRLSLDGFSNRRLRVTFQPVDVEEANYVLDIDNTRNERNTVSVRIVTSVTTDAPIVGLETSCGSELDFGDRYAFHPFSKKIWIRSHLEEPLDIKLSSDVPNQIAYELTIKDEDESTAQQFSKLASLSPSSGVSTAQSSPKSASNQGRQTPSDLHFGQEVGRMSTSQMDPASTNDKDDVRDPTESSRDDKWPTYKKNSVEELTLNPGQTRWLRVWYRPTVGQDSETTSRNSVGKSGTLQNKHFRLFLRTSTHYSMTIFCKSRVCESIVRLTPRQTQRSTVVRINNCSDLTAFLAVKYVSKCVTANVRDMVIAPRQAYDLLLSYVPRKVNPEYEKQITIVNLRNRKNDTVFILRANVIDRNRVSIHALYYKILAPTPTNEIDMGMTVEGYPAINCFDVRNATAKRLKIRFESSPFVKLFLCNIPLRGRAADETGKGKLTQSVPKHSSIRQHLLLAQMDERQKALEKLGEAVQAKSTSGPGDENGNLEAPRSARKLAERECREALCDIVDSLKSNTSIPTFFSDSEAERSYVDAQLRPAMLLSRAVRHGFLTAVSSEVAIEGDQTVTIFACFTPMEPRGNKRLSSKIKPVEERLLVHLVEFDKSVLASYKTYDGRELSPTEIAPREVTFSVLACRSESELAQKMLNFGHLQLGEQRAKSLLIHNKAEAPLLYAIQKTGSVASGDLRFDLARYGVIRPYSSKEVSFVFSPSLAGAYREVITIENLLDKRDVQLVTVKAQIHKRSNFHLLGVSSVDFGLCAVNEPSEREILIKITNDSDKSRKFSAEIGPKLLADASKAGDMTEPWLPNCLFSLEAQQMERVSEADDINIEMLEQKVKIYRKKGKEAKALKALEEIDRLKRAKVAVNPAPKKRETSTERQSPIRRINFSLRGSESQIMHVKIIPTPESAGQVIHFSMIVYETKNRDQQRSVDLVANIQKNSRNNKRKDLETSIHVRTSPEKLLHAMNKLEALELSTTMISVNELVVGTTQYFTIRVKNKLKESVIFMGQVPQSNTLGLRSPADYSPRVFSRGDKPPLPKATTKGPLPILVTATSNALDVALDPISAKLEPGEEIDVQLQVTASSAGKHIQSVIFSCVDRNDVDEQLLIASVNSVVKPLILILEADDDGSLDLGRGVIHPSKTYAIEKTVTLQSLAEKPFLLKARSNLSSQVFVFNDEGNTVDDMLMEPKGTRTISICVAPKFNIDELKDGTCRTLIGGLQLFLTAPADGREAVVVEQTVKFSTVVGISLVEIDRKTLRLGAVSSSRAILRDQCVITNKSQGLDARFELVPSSKRVRISKSREVLKPGASVTIYVTLSCETVGLCIEFIELKNIDIPTETTRVEIGAFVDPQEVSFASLTANNQSGIDLLENLRVYVVPSEDNEDQYNVVHSEVREISLQLVAGKMLDEEQCFFLSKYAFEFKPEAEALLDKIDPAVLQDMQARGVFQVTREWFNFGGERRRLSLNLALRRCNEFLPAMSKLLRGGQVVDFDAAALLTSTKRQLELDTTGKRLGLGVIKVLQVKGQFCYSKIGLVSDQPINFGFIGHCNGWMSVLAETGIQNLSGLPATFVVGDVPPEVEIVDDTFSGEIEAFGTAKIWLKLVSDQLRDWSLGSVNFSVPVKNTHNPKNTLMLQLCATVTAPWLSFERLAREDTWQLQLAPLTIPGGSDVDGWFRATNVGDQTAVLEFHLDPIKEPFGNVFVFSVVELSSGSALKNLTLSSGESIAIRVIVSMNSLIAMNASNVEESLKAFQITPDKVRSSDSVSSRVQNTKRGILSVGKVSSASPMVAPTESDEEPEREEDQEDEEKGMETQLNRHIASLRIRCFIGNLEEPHEVIQIFGSARAGPSISVSPRMLTLVTDSSSALYDLNTTDALTSGSLSETLTLFNRWEDVPVKFTTEIIGLPDDIIVVLSPSEGEIPAGSTLNVIVSLKNTELAKSEGRTAPLHGSILIHGSSFSSSPASTVALAIAFGMGVSSEAPAQSEETGSQAEDDSLKKSRNEAKPPILEALSFSKLSTTDAFGTTPSLISKNVSLDGSSSEEVTPLSVPTASGELIVDDISSNSFSLPVSVARKSRPSKPGTPIVTEGKPIVNDNVIILKGCSTLPGSGLRFEANVGQVTIGKVLKDWKLTLEVSSNNSIEYKVHRLRSFDAEQGWFTVSRNGGILEAGRIHDLDLAFIADRVGVYSTYLLIENRGNPSDLKTIRVSMEVVADGSSTSIAKDFFSVLCDGGTQGIEYSMTTFDHVYRHRSFFICNNSDIEMEFLLSHDLPSRFRTEVNFSSTNATLRKVNSLVINPHQKRRVFIYFRPRLELEERNVQDGSDLSMHTFVRKFNLYVNCRLVKDFQETLEVTASCKPAQLLLSRTDFLFDLHLTGADDEVSDSLVATDSMVSPGIRSASPEDDIFHALVERGKHLEEKLEIRNLFPSELSYEVRNDSLFFSVDGQLKGALSDQSQSVVVSLRLDVTRLLDRLSFLVKEKYVEEHIAIYNKNVPEEYYWVRLRLSFGAASEFSAVMHSRAYTFSILEELVARFLQKFSVFWSGFRRPRVAGAGADSVEIAMASVGGDADSVQQMLAKIRERQRTATAAAGTQSLDEWFQQLNSAVNTEVYRDLLFDMHYVTDELVYFALRHGPGAALRIATTLFTFIFKHNVFLSVLQSEGASVKPPQLISPWAGQLRHFLSFFPDKATHFKALLALEARLQQAPLEPFTSSANVLRSTMLSHPSPSPSQRQ